MNELVIIGGGVCRGDLTERMLGEIERADCLFIQTADMPTAQEALLRRPSGRTLDFCFEQAEDFDALNRLIYEALSREEGRICYMVYGSANGDNTAAYARSRALTEGCAVYMLPGVSLAQAALAAAGGEAGSLIMSASEYRPGSLLDAGRARLYYALDSRILASELKCGLLEYYPDYAQMKLYSAMSGQVKSIPLFELDRQEASFYNYAACVYLPPLSLEECRRYSFEQLVGIMRRLRGENGCPWDLEQTHQSLRKHLIEEAYEALDAINQDDPEKLYDELGDVLMQVVFHAQIASEYQEFDISDVITAVCAKLIRRHPHIFDSVQAQTSSEVLYNWEQIKKGEKQISTLGEMAEDLPKSMPALMRAFKLSQRLKGAFPQDAQSSLDFALADINSIKSGIIAKEDLELKAGLFLIKLCAALRSAGVQPEMALNRACDLFIKAVRRAEAKKNGLLDGQELETALQSVILGEIE